jgi:hypothetical protein
MASGEDDNHFVGCASLTDMSKRGGNLVEREGAVDVDPDVPGSAGAASGSKWAGPSLTARIPVCDR